MDKVYKTSLNLDYETGEKLKQLAKDEDRSVASYLRRAVTEYVITEVANANFQDAIHQESKKHNTSSTTIQQTKPAQSNKKHIKEFIL